jgi:hypothetical protein
MTHEIMRIPLGYRLFFYGSQSTSAIMLILGASRRPRSINTYLDGQQSKLNHIRKTSPKKVVRHMTADSRMRSPLVGFLRTHVNAG